MPKALSRDFYASILKKIKEEIARGKDAIAESYRREVIKTHWNIGAILEKPFTGLFENSSERARMIERLAKDLGRPASFFYDLSKFYRYYPLLPQTSLSWSHYSNLIRVDDEARRGEFEEKAIQESLSALKLYQLIFLGKIENKRAEENNQSAILAEPGALSCARGKLYRYRCLFRKDIACAKNQGLVDLGFGFLRKINTPPWKNNGSPVSICSYKDNNDYFIRRATKHPEYLYTYQAAVVRVIDGDTLVLNIDLGFDSWIEQKLRLRGIDAPEMSTLRGVAAKDHVKEIFERVDFVICKTYKEDKYGRYLADIFYSCKEKDPQVIAREGVFLNQELVDQGYAKLYEEEG